MLIDWFTVGAQLLNFLILVWLLKRFLYKPVLDAIDAREKRIAGELAKAASKLIAAQQEHDEFDAKNKAFDAERGALAAKAVKDGAAEHDAMLLQARKDADELRAKSANALAADRALLGQRVTRLAQHEVFAIARKALADLADTSLEERMGAVFTRRLRIMDAPSKASLATALRDCTDPAQLRSSFDLPAAERAIIQNALNEAFSAEVRVRFVTLPDAVCGIELTASGQKLAWSIGDYLKTLEQKLGAQLEVESAPAPDKSVVTAVPAGPASVTDSATTPSAPAAPAKVAPAKVAPAAPVATATAVPPVPAAPVPAAPVPAAPVPAAPFPAAPVPAAPVPAAPVPTAAVAVAS